MRRRSGRRRVSNGNSGCRVHACECERILCQVRAAVGWGRSCRRLMVYVTAISGARSGERWAEDVRGSWHCRSVRRLRALDVAGSREYLSYRGASSYCPLSEARCSGAGFRVSGGQRVTFFAYLDEFGHIGPYVSRGDPRYKESPVFGLAGFVLPAEAVRGFGTWFFQRKCELLAFEIARSGEHPALWEKKGASRSRM